MSAVPTKKPFGDQGVQMTFPYNFIQHYNIPLNYFPSYEGSPPDIMIGTDFQAKYHEEKRVAAVAAVMDGLQSRRTSQRLMMTGPHNYHLPKPVLGQRKFANPSHGMVGFPSARRDGSTAPFVTTETGAVGAGLRGGVMKTREGADYYQKNLADRVTQLNRINAVAQGYAVKMGSDHNTEDNTRNGSQDEVTFFLYLRALTDAITDGDITRFTFENVKEIIQMLIRSAPKMEDLDLNDIIEACYLGYNSLLNYQTQEYTVDPEKPAYVETLKFLLTKINYIAKVMLTNLYASTRDKQTIMKGLVRTLELNRFMFKESDSKNALSRQNALINLLNTERGSSAALDHRMEDFDGDGGGDEDDFGNGGGGGDGQFGFSAEAREDSEMRGMPRAPLAGRNDDPQRQRFGERNGQVIYGDSGYFGESADRERDAFPPYVQPLGMSGIDPNAQEAPQMDGLILQDVVDDQIKRVLEDLGFADTDDVEEFVKLQYPNPNNFVKEVADGLVERGFTAAQVANGMQRTNLPFFADYIAENSGPLGPEPARAARPAGLGGIPLGGLSAPVYEDGNGDGLADLPPRREDSSGAPRGAQSSAGLDGIFQRNNLPRDRDIFNREYNTIGKLRQLGSRIPREYGGPYNPREDTKVRNAKARIITLLKNIDSSF